MARTSEPHTNPWIAFAAGAVVMLLIVLLWAAWNRAHDAAGTLRADLALPSRSELPSLPTNPPPEGPRLPQVPSPEPR
ncbi:MAG TPA: hypothetical protein VHV27_01275 [Phenylobacterium sp.]|jgi:hypothetical protein|nr:hypothetical protein [Phenylobacterium sp.]